MATSSTTDFQALAAEVVRRHSTSSRVPSRWSLRARWRGRRYRQRLIEAPLERLNQAVAEAEKSKPGHLA